MTNRCVVAGLLVVTACSDPQTSGLATAHLVVDPSDSEVVCRGSLDDMEAQVVRVARLLDVSIPQPILVHYGPSAVDEHCTGSSLGELSGCARGLKEDTYIAADGSSVYHELVHAVRLANGAKGPRFFEEGIAGALAGFRPLAYSVELQADDVERGPEFLAATAWGDFQSSDYVVASHFMLWLMDTFGQESVTSFFSDNAFTSDVGIAFSNTFGLSLREAEAVWRSDSKGAYYWGEICDPARDLAWIGAKLTLDGRVDCEMAPTLGPSILNTIRVRSNCFVVAQAGAIQVEFAASGGVAEFQSLGDCGEAGGPLTPEHFQSKMLGAGETLDLPFAPCTWEIAVSTQLSEPMDFSLRLTRL